MASAQLAVPHRKSLGAAVNHSLLEGRMTYRLNLYCNAKLISTELLEVSLEQAKGLACSALDCGQAERAELVNKTGSIMFQRWAVL
jgi:hypothetical protein